MHKSSSEPENSLPEPEVSPLITSDKLFPDAGDDVPVELTENEQDHSDGSKDDVPPPCNPDLDSLDSVDSSSAVVEASEASLVFLLLRLS